MPRMAFGGKEEGRAVDHIHLKKKKDVGDSKPQILRYKRRISPPNPSFCENLEIFLCFSAFPLRGSNFFCNFAPDWFGRDRATHVIA